MCRGVGGFNLSVKETSHLLLAVASQTARARCWARPTGEVAPNDRRHRTKLRDIYSTRSALAASHAFVTQIALTLEVLQILLVLVDVRIVIGALTIPDALISELTGWVRTHVSVAVAIAHRSHVAHVAAGLIAVVITHRAPPRRVMQTTVPQLTGIRWKVRWRPAMAE